MPRGFPNCACRDVCGDVAEEDDKPRAVCKGLKIVTPSGRVIEFGTAARRTNASHWQDSPQEENHG